MKATKTILEVGYKFSNNVDKHKKLLLIEAQKFSKADQLIGSNLISNDDFSFYWLHADEFILSSPSNIHFGHYKLTSYNK